MRLRGPTATEGKPDLAVAARSYFATERISLGTWGAV